MLTLRPLAVLALLAALLLTGWSQEPSRPPLAEAIKTVIEKPEYKTAHWGLYVVDAKTGAVLLDHQSEKLFVPASCTKLFSVAAALETLGPDYRFSTRVLHTGKIHEETRTLSGDLILLASGDLTMGGRTLPDGSVAFKDNDHTYANGNTRGQLTEVDPLQGLNQIAQKIAEKVSRIEGEVLVDDRLFEKAESTGSGPGRLTPILINDNLIDFTITAGSEPGQTAKVEYRPAGSAILVDTQVETVAEKTENKANKASITVTMPSAGRYVVRGTIPKGHKPLVRVREVDDPAAHARSLLIDALQRAGVKVKASSLNSVPADKLPPVTTISTLPVLTEYTSPTLAEHARLILKVSHNLHASTLPLILAAHKQQKSLSQGLKLQAEALKRLGVPLESISFAGGAGGARADHVTPKAAIILLQKMAGHSAGAAYRRALPIVGVDGTPASAISKDSPARGKFQAKTGTLSWTNGLEGNDIMTSKALAGYGETAAGRQILFAFFVNNVKVAEEGTTRVGKDLGRLCEIVFTSE